MKALNSKYNLIKLNLARNSLRYIVRVYGIKEMYIPYYVCPVIRRALIQEKCKPLFYHIDDSFMPLQDFSKNAFILYPNYFGICDKNVDMLCEKYSRLIIDNAHSFYNKPKGFASFNSARKFMPVYNGSYLWIKDVSLSVDMEEVSCGAPLSEEEMYKNEREFEFADIKFLCSDTADSISKFNDMNSRKEKFLMLHKKYKSLNCLDIDENVCSPFCYPCLLQTEAQADELAEKLKNDGQKIYRYWGKMPRNFSEYKFYSRLVSVPLGKEL